MDAQEVKRATGIACEYIKDLFDDCVTEPQLEGFSEGTLGGVFIVLRFARRVKGDSVLTELLNLAGGSVDRKELLVRGNQVVSMSTPRERAKI